MSGDKYVTAAGYICIAIFLSIYLLIKFLKINLIYGIVGEISTYVDKVCIFMSIIGLLLVSSGWLSIGRRFKISEACICGETGLVAFSALFLFYMIVTLSHARDALRIIYEKLGKNVLSDIVLFVVLIVAIFVLTHVISHFTVSRVSRCYILRIAGYLHVLLLSSVISYFTCTLLNLCSMTALTGNIMRTVVVVLVFVSCMCSSVGVYRLKD